LLSVSFNDSGAAIGGSLTEALAGPDGLAGHFVEGHYSGVLSAGGADDFVSIDEQGFGNSPFDVLTFEFL
jgi:hypothetical protein